MPIQNARKRRAQQNLARVRKSFASTSRQIRELTQAFKVMFEVAISAREKLAAEKSLQPEIRRLERLRAHLGH
jgi:hypothetical protein